MLRRTFCLLTAAALFGVAGCGGGADGLVKELISDMNAIADAVEKGEKKEKIEELTKKMEETTKKLDALKLSEDEKKKLMEKHKPEMEKAGQRMVAAMMKGAFQNMGMPGMTMPGMPGGKATNPVPSGPGK